MSFVVALFALSAPAWATIDNTAQVSATYNGNSVVSNSATVSVPVAAPSAAMSVAKSATINDGGDGTADAGDTIDYSFTLTNTGNVTLQNVTLADPLATPIFQALTDNGTPGDSFDGGSFAGWDNLAPGDALQYTVTYTILPADVANAVITNTATGNAQTNLGAPVTASDSIDTYLNFNPALNLNKVATLNDGGDGIANAGDTISYQLTVTNTGNVPLTNVSIDDPLLMAGLPGEQQMIAMMMAAATGADPIMTASTGGADFDPEAFFEGPIRIYAPVATAQAARIQPGLEVPQLAVALHAKRKLVQLSGDRGAIKAGDKLGIYFELTNSGEGPLTNITVEQQGAESFGSALDILLPNETDNASVIFIRTVMAEDIVAGALTLPAIIRAKARGRTRTFAIVDDLPLSGIAQVDELTTASITPASVPSLAAGANTVFAGTYILTQADIDAGHRENTAHATGTDPLGGTVDSPDATADVLLPPVPGISVIKTGIADLGPDNVASVGDIITYAFAVKNTGNVTLSGITLADTIGGVTVTGGPIASLAPGVTDNTTFAATYPITQVDIDAGHFDNQATVTGTLPPPYPGPGAPTTTTDLSDDDSETENDLTIVSLLPEPEIALKKEFDTGTYPTGVEDVNGNNLVDAGDRVYYKFSVMNVGNVTLSDVYVQDRNPLITVTPAPPTGLSLAPGQEDLTTFTGQYTLTQADVDAGFFDNTADTYGTAPDSTVVTDESDPAVYTGNGPLQLVITATPGIALLKTVTSIDDNNNNSINDTGDTIHYGFTVINTGNVTLSNITLNDPNAVEAGGPIATLLPGTFDDTTFTAQHVITGSDVTAGSVVNQATATADTPHSGQVSDLSDSSDPNENDPTVVATVENPAIALIKQVTEVDDTNNNNVVDVGDTITYQFTVRNTGNVELTNVSVTDTIGGVTVGGGPVIPLMEAGDTDSTTFTATYVLTSDDIDNGQFANQASASGTAPNATVVTDLSDEASFAAGLGNDDPTVTYFANAPAIAIVKTLNYIDDVNNNSVQDIGDRVYYTLTVTNTGNTPLSNVTVSDNNGVVPPASILLLPVGVSNSTTFLAYHDLTLADLNAGTVSNTATVTATGPGGPVTDDSDYENTADDRPTEVLLNQSPGIALVKTVASIEDVNGNGITDIGDIIHYEFAVHNTGNVTIENITLLDPNAVLGGASSIASLDPGDVNTTAFTAEHTVTLADAEAEQVVNTATANGTASGSGVPVSDVSDDGDVIGGDPTITAVAPPVPLLTKTVAKSEINRGERVTYTITASGLKAGPYDIADIMPPGFDYVPGSATVNGSPVEPVEVGNVLTFASITPVSNVIVIKLKLVSSATVSTGRFINKAQLIPTASGDVLASAQVAVTIKEEHIFDCGEIIGRVFDDRNANGYADNGEPGLPGVRVVTVKGLLVTTDKEGRFHVACADVPNAAIGSNFLMKLDTRTLPAGYKLTTENPRDVRLTRGKIVKLNFGASKNHDIELELRRDAFAGAGVDLRSQWLSGIDRLVALLEQGRGDLAIVYRCGEYAPIADQRLEAVRALVEERWHQSGNERRLVIKTRVECGK